MNTEQVQEIISQTCQQSQLTPSNITNQTTILPPCLHSHSKIPLSSSSSSSSHETMKESMERFSILPFSIGCVSHSSIDVIESHPKKSQRETNSPPPCGEGEEKLKGSLGLAHLPKPNIGEKLNKLVKGFKSLPQRFQVYREVEEEDGHVELEIGFPTDVQHIGHIGWDGPNGGSVSAMKSWERPAELMSIPFPSLALRQFELAEDGASI